MDPDTATPDPTLHLLLFLAFLALGGLVVLCQNSLVELSDQKLKKTAGDAGADPGLERAARLLARPGRFSSAMRGAYTFCHLCAVGFLDQAADSCPLFFHPFWAAGWGRLLQSLLVTLAGVTFIMVFSRGIPRRLAARHADSLAPALSGTAAAIVALFTPLAWFVEKAVSLVRDWGGGLVSSCGVLMAGVVSGGSTFVIGLIFSFYILLQKERLARQGRQVLYALLPGPWADRSLEVLRFSGRTFSSFLSGQCVEAVILGALFVAAMTVFRMPYALLVGVLIALTALIPVVGAFIGCVVGALLIAVTNPWQAVGFVVLFLVIQQIEGNLIYPHVVGNSVGLPSIWVLAAVTIGGGVLGIGGMLLAVPLAATLYQILRDDVSRRSQSSSASKLTPPV